MIVNTNAGRRPLRGGPVEFQRMVGGGQRGSMIPLSMRSGTDGFGIMPPARRTGVPPSQRMQRGSFVLSRSGTDGFGAFTQTAAKAFARSNQAALAAQAAAAAAAKKSAAQSYAKASNQALQAMRQSKGFRGFGIFPPMRRMAPLPLRQRGSFMPVRGGFNAFPDTQARYLEGFGAFPYVFNGFGDDAEEVTPSADEPSTMSMIDSILSSGAKLGQAYTSYLTRNKPTVAARTGVAATSTTGMPTWVWAVGGVAILGGAYLLLKK
jgi:type II secretory pathway pseudopilin PulG